MEILAAIGFGFLATLFFLGVIFWALRMPKKSNQEDHPVEYQD